MKKGQTRRLMLASVLVLSCTVLTGCGSGSNGGNGGSGGGATGFTVGGTITGLGSSTGLVLANGSATLQVPANSTSFTMPAQVADDASYNVTVKVHPTAVQCSVANGEGTVDGANVTGISVSCQAGTESVLHSFAGGSSDGTYPQGVIQALDGSFNGMTETGGANNNGVLFNLTPDGTAEKVLYSFPLSFDTFNLLPYGNIIQATDGNFYGLLGFAGLTPPPGSDTNTGAIYKINPAGTSETNLFFFSLPDAKTQGAYPQELIQASDGNFYGIASEGGANNDGVVFKITSSGTESILFSFQGGTAGFAPQSLIQAKDGNFYGLAMGGASDDGIVFKITPGGAETILHSFTGGPTDGLMPTVLGSGALTSPISLIQGSDGNFYGVTGAGGRDDDGVVFKITSSGAESVLYSFAGGSTDGYYPNALIQAADGNFYGTTYEGGAGVVGVLFKVTPSGTETVLHSFAGEPLDGANPLGLIQASNGGLYGTTSGGGTNNYGTIFELN